MKGFSTTKPYDNLSKFIKRKKYGKSGNIASLIIETCLSSKTPMAFNQIKQDVVRAKGIFPSKEYLNYSDWRHAMTTGGILVCMASYKELQEPGANNKASLFRIGDSIKKYIEAALDEKSSVRECLDLKADLEDLDSLEKRMETRLAQAATQEQVNDLKLEIDDLKGVMEDVLLTVMPPNNEERKIIVRNYRYNPEELILKLKENSEKEELQ